MPTSWNIEICSGISIFNVTVASLNGFFPWDGETCWRRYMELRTQVLTVSTPWSLYFNSQIPCVKEQWQTDSRNGYVNLPIKIPQTVSDNTLIQSCIIRQQIMLFSGRVIRNCKRKHRRPLSFIFSFSKLSAGGTKTRLN